MVQAKSGDTVKVHYTGKLADGTVFDSSEGRDPLEFAIGEGQIIPGFEQAVIGMAPGESKTAEISSDEAYGPHRSEMVLEVEREQIPEDIEVQPGQQLQVQHPSGQQIPVVVTEVAESKVTLDANHPLAGQDLTFDIELVNVEG
ncbi:peptidylprolyl isomerase [Euhalothece natronophila Z-M001]|uniref:Peptidyl-prolyl cis-trans isomerase n=1 Tax=Euhalothece natronophila Z-M001 TaxID=522448 RepID=A0A5B8NMB0_9CHRO|nr:peptidylprolyl isomerase [Euhalothece natronophila]QDZ39229.1 peptidylprolyl isomerase [Euhalothece natronophila Z-M001]